MKFCDISKHLSLLFSPLKNVLKIQPQVVSQHSVQSKISTAFTGFPCTLENLEDLENEKINFQAWKSPGQKKMMTMSWKNPGNSLKIHMKLELSIFLEDLYPQKVFLPQSIVVENLNFDLEASWKSP